jgi:hypothetical protein
MHLDGIPSYQASWEQSIPGMKLSQIQLPGAIVAVRVNPEDPADVAIDFHTDPPTVAAG